MRATSLLMILSAGTLCAADRMKISVCNLMKAHWTTMDYCDMARRPLSFTPGDIDLIQRGLIARAAAVAVVAPLIGGTIQRPFIGKR